jgi:hypothetical protein
MDRGEHYHTELQERTLARAGTAISRQPAPSGDGGDLEDDVKIDDIMVNQDSSSWKGPIFARSQARLAGRALSP